MPADDLISLLNATGFPLSRKVFNGLTTANGSDRVAYRDYMPPVSLVDRMPDYPAVSLATAAATSNSAATCNVTSGASDGPLIVERNAIQYNVDELIKQSEADQKLKVRLNEEVASSHTKIGKCRVWSFRYHMY